MKRQHPYDPKCKCQRCKAVIKLVQVVDIAAALRAALKSTKN